MNEVKNRVVALVTGAASESPTTKDVNQDAQEVEIIQTTRFPPEYAVGNQQEDGVPSVHDIEYGNDGYGPEKAADPRANPIFAAPYGYRTAWEKAILAEYEAEKLRISVNAYEYIQALEERITALEISMGGVRN